MDNYRKRVHCSRLGCWKITSVPWGVRLYCLHRSQHLSVAQKSTGPNRLPWPLGNETFSLWNVHCPPIWSRKPCARRSVSSFRNLGERNSWFNDVYISISDVKFSDIQTFFLGLQNWQRLTLCPSSPSANRSLDSGSWHLEISNSKRNEVYNFESFMICTVRYHRTKNFDLARRYKFWPGMGFDVIQYVKKSEIWQPVWSGYERF